MYMQSSCTGISKAPIDSTRNQALKNLTEKLREIHDFDHMEQEGDFLKRQLSAVKEQNPE